MELVQALRRWGLWRRMVHGLRNLRGGLQAVLKGSGLRVPVVQGFYTALRTIVNKYQFKPPHVFSNQARTLWRITW